MWWSYHHWMFSRCIGQGAKQAPFPMKSLDWMVFQGPLQLGLFCHLCLLHCTTVIYYHQCSYELTALNRNTGICSIYPIFKWDKDIFSTSFDFFMNRWEKKRYYNTNQLNLVLLEVMNLNITIFFLFAHPSEV